MILNKDLTNYREYANLKRINGSATYNYEIGDIVKISQNITGNLGYRGQHGIVQSYSGVSNYLYIMAFDARANRYWCCGFNESELSNPNVYEITNLDQLLSEFCNWTMRNNVQFESKYYKN